MHNHAKVASLCNVQRKAEVQRTWKCYVLCSDESCVKTFQVFKEKGCAVLLIAFRNSEDPEDFYQMCPNYWFYFFGRLAFSFSNSQVQSLMLVVFSASHNPTNPTQ